MRRTRPFPLSPGPGQRAEGWPGYMPQHHEPRTEGCRAARRRADAHPPHERRTRAQGLQHPVGNDARRQDDVDAADGRPAQAHGGRDLVQRQERHRRAGARAPRGDGLPAVHQLRAPVGVRQHRLAVAGRRRERRAGQRARRAHRRIAAAFTVARPATGRAVGRPAAAHRAGARAGEGRRPGAARRAAGQPRLQAARGAAR